MEGRAFTPEDRQRFPDAPEEASEIMEWVADSGVKLEGFSRPRAKKLMTEALRVYGPTGSGTGDRPVDRKTVWDVRWPDFWDPEKLDAEEAQSSEEGDGMNAG